MKKVTKLVLMLCLVLSAAFCYAHGAARTENYEKENEGTPIIAILKAQLGSTDKVTFRATDSFEVTGPFQVNSGGEMTVIMQECPE